MFLFFLRWLLQPGFPVHSAHNEGNTAGSVKVPYAGDYREYIPFPILYFCNTGGLSFRTAAHKMKQIRLNISTAMFRVTGLFMKMYHLHVQLNDSQQIII